MWSILKFMLLLFVFKGSTSDACNPCDLLVYVGSGDRLRAKRTFQNPQDLQIFPSENIVWARYWRTYEDEGWDALEISVIASIPIPDTLKAQAAGYAEGQLQADRIFDYWTNYRLNEFKTPMNEPTPELLEWLEIQQQFVRDQLISPKSPAFNQYLPPHPVSSSQLDSELQSPAGGNSHPSYSYWELMTLVMHQFDGFCQGFWDAALPGKNMTRQELYLLQSVGDLYDLTVLFPQHGESSHANAASGKNGPKFGLGQRFTGHGYNGHEHSLYDRDGVGRMRKYTPGHGIVGDGGFGGGDMLECSALIKLGKDDGKKGRSSDTGMKGIQDKYQKAFWAGHATWRPYYAMLRTWKIYDLPWSKTGPITISSSPGLVAYSKDDWYSTDKLVIMETTNGIYNQSLYDHIQPECVLMWQRAQVANLGAATGKEWVRSFELYNSGTYNNQWMVLDVEMLQTKGAVKDILWVLEQLPGTTQSADVSSELLEKGYWASYNVPYFPRIYNLSGYPATKNLHQTCPRAKLFAREQKNVVSLVDMKRVIRLNRFQQDDLSGGDPAHAIASRYDLEPLNLVPGTQQLMDLEGFSHRHTHAVSGPTSDDQPPFCWDTFCPDHDEVEEVPADDAGTRLRISLGVRSEPFQLKEMRKPDENSDLKRSQLNEDSGDFERAGEEHLYARAHESRKWLKSGGWSVAAAARVWSRIVEALSMYLNSSLTVTVKEQELQPVSHASDVGKRVSGLLGQAAVGRGPELDDDDEAAGITPCPYEGLKNKDCEAVSHVGVAECFSFDWQVYRASLPWLQRNSHKVDEESSGCQGAVECTRRRRRVKEEWGAV
ncbi:hypothetical protein CEUSTIGMA_g5738.t1 [Chlamydomonas eustigma]|uniref:Phospholipase B-like n=1 Tax=Chlamydomonas eustigma TaxID=1157962 RepID=A0A250X5H5_9CHLO|nr:hypothetical protein CEUSTIGMA_g5738.t1 [Chlamydomonas eustigma]|eukprot:GAX78296.1 hypothetical protein CEUSTIGMA_g5738.t1 [Chlamydomonas eustigma]